MVGLFISLGVSISLDVVLILTLDLDTVKKLVSTIEKISTTTKSLSRWSIMLRYLDKSQKSWQSQFILTILIKILMQPNLDAKVSILKYGPRKKIVSRHKEHSRQFSKGGLDTKDNLDWSRLSRPPGLVIYLSVFYLLLLQASFGICWTNYYV